MGNKRAPFAHFTLDRAGIIRDLTDSGALLLGHAPCEILGRAFGEFVSLNPQPFDELLASIFATPDKLSCKTVSLRSDRHRLQAEIEASVDVSSQSCHIAVFEPIRYLGAEPTPRRSEAAYRKLYESIRDAFVSVDMAGHIQEYNAVFREMLGYSDEQLSGLSQQALTPEKWHGSEAEIVDQQILTRGYSDIYEKEYRRNDGTVFPVELRTFLIRDDGGQPSRMWTIVRDITERKKGEQALRDSLNFSRAVIASIRDGFSVLDSDGVHQTVNPSLCRMTGFSEQELIGRGPPHPYWAPECYRTIEAAFEQTLSGIGGEFELVFMKQQGERFPVLVSASAIRNDAGEIVSYAAIVRDLTEKKRLEDESTRAAAVFSNAHEGITVTDAEERIIAVNPAFTELTGYTSDDACGLTHRILKSGRHGPEFYRSMWHQILSTGHWQGEVWNRHKTGELYPELLTISAILNDDGKLGGYVGIFTDISGIKNYQHQLELLAHYDPLTGLINRRLLEARLDHALNAARRKCEAGALLLIDLDRFKDVNDAFGHPAGDELLQQVAGRLQARLRQSDSLARLGGDEFAVMLEPPMSAQLAANIADALLDALATEFTLSTGQVTDISASIGIGLFPGHGETVKELMHHTDAALYQAKREGRATFRFFSEELTRQIREQIRMQIRLRDAIDNSELQVYYQAQLDIATGRVIGAEALVRWLDPEEGLIMPDRFIELSEQTRLIVPLGDWVLKTACQQVESWTQAGLPPIRLAVNLSAFQASRPDLASRIVGILAETGFVPQDLELELTETSWGEHRFAAPNLFGPLQNLGVTLALDDFGTGYSSLSKLEQYPVNALKIDRRFISALPHDETAAKITTAIIALAHTLGFRTIAEGVETDEQLRFLADQGCDACQGYLFSPPLPAEKFAARYLNAA